MSGYSVSKENFAPVDKVTYVVVRIKLKVRHL